MIWQAKREAKVRAALTGLLGRLEDYASCFELICNDEFVTSFVSIKDVFAQQ